ncbi:hypothetical protein [Pseudomonas sp. Irchel 3A7]|uniref:hypothetical protein n=1 Tax=Pseudomonas sp. Irchel 3A7 TaxID=2008913 RepID=UPI001140714D|nr:hypothetical protein [Pseudomonas sp. Irchel 3A7]
MKCFDWPTNESEIFSSWVYRQSLFSKSSTLDREDIAQLWTSCALSEDLDPDFTASSAFARLACDALNIRMDQRAILFQAPSAWIIPRYYRRSFCYGCLCESIANFQFPVFRKEWCSVATVVCDQHNTPLLDAVDLTAPKLNIAMKVFQLYHEQGLRCISASRYNEASQLFDSLLRMQSLLREFEFRGVRDGRLVNESGGVELPEWRSSKFLISLFLYPKFGLVNRLIPYRALHNHNYAFQQSFNLGPLIAGVAHRRAAIIILGWLHEVFSSDEDHGIEQFIRSAGNTVGFTDAKELGAASNGFSPEHSALISRRLMQWKIECINGRMQQFVSGFMESAHAKNWND